MTYAIAGGGGLEIILHTEVKTLVTLSTSKLYFIMG